MSLKITRGTAATYGLIAFTVEDTVQPSFALYKPGELAKLNVKTLADGVVNVSISIGQDNYNALQTALFIEGVDQTGQTNAQIRNTLSALFLEATGGGGGATSGSGITVVGTNVNLGRAGTALTVDADLDTTGGFFIFINQHTDGGKLDFDQVNFNTYVNGGKDNTGTNNAFLGLGSGRNNAGNNVCAFGFRSLSGNTQNSITAYGVASGDTQSGTLGCFFGRLAGDHNTGATLNAFGYTAGQNNTGSQVIAIGSTAGNGNTRSRVILLGDAASATANDQLVLSFNKMARFNFNGLTANRAYTVQDVDGVIALLKNGSGIIASATGFDLGGAITAPTTIDCNSNDLSITGLGCGFRAEPGSNISTIGDVSGSFLGSTFGVNDNAQKMAITNNLVTAPGGVAITADFIKILVSGVDYFIPLYQ